ncbi:MAG: alpha/beta hydrolase [Planctomycetes bacterium]|nr:alpha/beta hydrolase [Planctomycetota bacterium]
MTRQFRLPGSCAAIITVLTQTGCIAPLATFFEVLPVRVANRGLDIQAEFGRPFATCGGRVLRMDVFHAAQAVGPAPAVVLVHGGFWLYGERWYMHDWSADLAAHGYTAVSIDYRLIGQGGRYPEPVMDVLAAIAYLREYADELNVDPERIALFGVSAGAHLALLAGLAGDASIFDSTWPAGESTNVKAVVEIYGPTDFTVDPASVTLWQSRLVSLFLGYDQAGAPDLYREASAITYVRADGPPVFILHGTRDPIVPVTQARALRDALEGAGQPHEYYEMKDAGHFWGSMWANRFAQRHRDDILRFLHEHL